jgi:hypothetical protein
MVLGGDTLVVVVMAKFEIWPGNGFL